ncbi:MAG: hypothetical protein DBX55_03130 [Verrucomicrobia bacterium]|nr:MAG: hypothetical protein DBX55_03130 [Verrucomicrobiota bacterium]
MRNTYSFSPALVFPRSTYSFSNANFRAMRNLHCAPIPQYPRPFHTGTRDSAETDTCEYIRIRTHNTARNNRTQFYTARIITHNFCVARNSAWRADSIPCACRIHA